MVKLVFNIERIGWSKLEGQRRHDQRLGGDLSHIDVSMTQHNLVLHGSGDPKIDVRNCLNQHNAKPRADNDAPFNRFVVQPGEGFDWEDARSIETWLRNTKSFFQKEYGAGFAYAVAHADETTLHVHAICVPLYESKTKKRTAWKVSHKQHPATKGKGSYERLRRRCAEHLGFEYGEPGNKPRTIEQRFVDERSEMAIELSKKDAKAILEEAQIKADAVNRHSRSLFQQVNAVLAQMPKAQELKIRKTLNLRDLEGLLKAALGDDIDPREIQR